MAERRDCYEVLGVSRDAEPKAIKEAFHQLALRYHPDRSKEPDAEERFKEIAEAYAVLGNPKKRAEYDSGGFAGVTGMRPEDLFTGVDFENLFGDFGLDLGGLWWGRALRSPVRSAPAWPGSRRRCRGPGRGSAGDGRERRGRASLGRPSSPLRALLGLRCKAGNGAAPMRSMRRDRSNHQRARPGQRALPDGDDLRGVPRARALHRRGV